MRERFRVVYEEGRARVMSRRVVSLRSERDGYFQNIGRIWCKIFFP